MQSFNRTSCSYELIATARLKVGKTKQGSLEIEMPI